MFEFNFDNKENYKGLEKDIKNYNKKDNIPSILKLGLSSILGSALSIYLLNMYNITNLFIMFGSIVSSSLVFGTIIELTNKLVNKYKKSNAKNNMNVIIDSCKKNNIITNCESVSKSVIIKQSNKKIEEVSDDGVLSLKEDNTYDNYYLFLDNNENLNGILERKTLTKNNDEVMDNTSYYILENEDISLLEDRTKLVKKLVKKI